ncbi:MAG TPA: CHASE2 domain-containing protein [Cyclobacteriaceae bacterium]|nr:CHASE2 domain-containing protein [Cyclobacteriaceae bacterium]HMV07317.1 CHASE2 domain-containing protein [Cyclobacteriaceae bacterium]HMV89231.1 CHASE2 domain-containing protein [Cyclobacteriaceae bacterium]HMW99328.1 CHASE2 domain-containing protein [Cyclobacteriaceae bacterium]HMX48883.1 CHASE2 domain-containing protein [Cyclobacteriaceae bacterium]
MKKSFWLDAVIATSFTFILMWGLVKITQLRLFDAFDSIGQALGDVELTDYVFQNLRDDPLPDTSIVVVNIGYLTRRELAQQIAIISQFEPKVIGIDAFFHCGTRPRDTLNCPALKDTLGNAFLGQVIKDAGNVVLVTKLMQSRKLQSTDLEDVYDSLVLSDPIYRDSAAARGFASLETGAAFQDDVKTCRSFNPSMMVNGNRELAFSVQMAMMYDSVKTKEFLERDNFSEVINYRGNIVDVFGQTNYPQMYYTLDVSDVFQGNFLPGMIKDKIVIFGFLGSKLGDPTWSDKFYTPLNKKMAGKANPDMFGVVVHANIVSMIMNRDYVNKMDKWQEISMAVIICLLNVALFSLIHVRLPDWYDGITKLLQILELLLFTVLMVMIFSWYNFKFEITLTLAAIALVGDAYEIYIGVVKNLLNRLRRLGFRGLFTKRRKRVLTPENK